MRSEFESNHLKYLYYTTLGDSVGKAADFGQLDATVIDELQSQLRGEKK
ncbi:MAG TPA: hypothetical protein PKC28_15610 [Bdellovibrionales bacterium]|nr:hypothetical protein [Bdellovibrionales bacterium]